MQRWLQSLSQGLLRCSSSGIEDNKEFKENCMPEGWDQNQIEVGAFYWIVLAPDIVNSGRAEQGLVSV